MKVGDLVYIGLPNEPEDSPEQRAIIIEINHSEYMPSFRLYRLIDQSRIWMYQINIKVLNPL
jgi:hypothetical protein